MILPCTPVSLAVDFILSSRRFVSKKWPAHKVKFNRCLCLINHALFASKKIRGFFWTMYWQQFSSGHISRLQSKSPDAICDGDLLTWMTGILLTNMIRCKLQLDSILGELVMAGHNPCIVSSEKHMFQITMRWVQQYTTPAVLNSEYISAVFQSGDRYVHEEVQMLVRWIEGPRKVADGAQRAQVHLHDVQLGARDLFCEALFHLEATLECPSWYDHLRSPQC